MARLMAQILIYHSRHWCRLLLFCLIATAPVAAQYRLDHWTTANGLGNNIVIGVYTAGTTVYAATYGGLSIFLCRAITTATVKQTWRFGEA